MPVMSRLERVFCCSRVWRSTGAISASALPVDNAGKDVLEIGAGGGAVADRLLRANADVNLTVIDIDPNMVAAAATRLQRFTNATVRCADATDLPFDDDSFDTVVSCLMLHHVVAWEQTLAEVHRVLRRGGRFVGYDLVRNRFTVLLHTLDRSPHRLLTPRELTAGCEQQGLRVSDRPRLGGYFMTFAATTEP